MLVDTKCKMPEERLELSSGIPKPMYEFESRSGLLIQFLIRFLYFHTAVQYPAGFGGIIGNRISLAVAFS